MEAAERGVAVFNLCHRVDYDGLTQYDEWIDGLEWTANRLIDEDRVRRAVRAVDGTVHFDGHAEPQHVGRYRSVVLGERGLIDVELHAVDEDAAGLGYRAEADGC